MCLRELTILMGLPFCSKLGYIFNVTNTLVLIRNLYRLTSVDFIMNVQPPQIFINR